MSEYAIEMRNITLSFARKIANDEYSEDKLDEILRKYNVIKSDT